MQTSRAVTLTAIAGAVVLGVAAMVVEPYSGQGRRYQDAIRRFLTAASARDSVTLAKLAASPEAVATVRASAASDPGVVRFWAEQARARDIQRTGDTTWVWFRARQACEPAGGVAVRSLLVGFVGPVEAPRVAQVVGGCLAPPAR